MADTDETEIVETEEMHNPTFAEIQAEITAMLDVPDAELTDDQRKWYDEYLNELAAMEAGKIDGFGYFLRMESARADALEAEGKRLIARAKTINGKIGWLKNTYTENMRQAGLKKIRGDIYTMSVRENKSVYVANQNDVPEMYINRKITETPDKLAIREALKNGIDVPGCELISTYSLNVR